MDVPAARTSFCLLRVSSAAAAAFPARGIIWFGFAPEYMKSFLFAPMLWYRATRLPILFIFCRSASVGWTVYLNEPAAKSCGITPFATMEEKMDTEDQMARACDEWNLGRGTRECKHQPTDRTASIIMVRTRKGRFYTWTLTDPVYYIEAGTLSNSDLGDEIQSTENVSVMVLEEYQPGEWTPEGLYEKAKAYYTNSIDE